MDGYFSLFFFVRIVLVFFFLFTVNFWCCYLSFFLYYFKFLDLLFLVFGFSKELVRRAEGCRVIWSFNVVFLRGFYFYEIILRIRKRI